LLLLVAAKGQEKDTVTPRPKPHRMPLALEQFEPHLILGMQRERVMSGFLVATVHGSVSGLS